MTARAQAAPLGFGRCRGAPAGGGLPQPFGDGKISSIMPLGRAGTWTRVVCRAAAALLLLGSVGAVVAGPRALSIGRLGRVRLYEPVGPPTSLVFVFSDLGGWSEPLDDAARSLAARGVAVVGTDLREYLAGLAASGDGCHYVVAEIEDASRRLQRDLGGKVYRTPILAGVGAGATLAYAALAQSPAATVAGAVGVDEVPVLPTRVPLCQGAPVEPVPGGGFRYGPREPLPGWWRRATEGRDPGERLLSALLPEISRGGPTGELSDLPLAEIEAEGPAELFAVIYSGDGGWRDIDKDIGEVLAAHGVPTVGVDSLRYFWTEKTPAEVAHDLERILDHYGERWAARRVVLVGYSFGASVLPFAVNRLSPRWRERIVQISLLGLEPTADFEIRVSGWLGAGPSSESRPVLPELRSLDRSRLQCFYGEEEDEDETLCPSPELQGAEIVRTAGGHHFDGDYEALGLKILEGARRRS